MELTRGQDMALEAVAEIQRCFPEGGGIVVISGYAGTGKTTCLKTFAETQALTVLAPTGKASMRVREVCPNANAMTVHRWLYEVSEDPTTGKVMTKVKDVFALPANKTIFVDEASMVNAKMAVDLIRICKREKLNLVFIGDDFQLPPVEPNDDAKSFSVFANDFPAHIKVKMTEVVRQALDNPIIRASMEIRDLRSSIDSFAGLPTVKESDLSIAGAKTVDDGGAIICHRNATRHALNVSVRNTFGFGEKIVRGEPLMVTFNNYNLDLFNGEIVKAVDEPCVLGTKPIPVTDRFCNESLNMWFYLSRVETPSGNQQILFADREAFGTQGKISSKFIRLAGEQASRHLKIQDQKKLGPISYAEMQEIEPAPVLNCNLGYCLTAHKAQGSEWNEIVLVVEPTIRLHQAQGRRWLYTALTRAKRRVSVCWS